MRFAKQTRVERDRVDPAQAGRRREASSSTRSAAKKRRSSSPRSRRSASTGRAAGNDSGTANLDVSLDDVAGWHDQGGPGS